MFLNSMTCIFFRISTNNKLIWDISEFLNIHKETFTWDAHFKWSLVKLNKIQWAYADNKNKYLYISGNES